MLRLAVIVISYNTRDLLRSCLAAVENAAARGRARMVVDTLVIDNASKDGSAEMVRNEFPAVRLTALDSNIGFTRGNNLGLAQLGFDPRPRPSSAADSPPEGTPDYVLLLNPDTEVATDSLVRLVHFMDATPGAGMCGPQLRYGNGDFQHGAFRLPGLAQIGLDLFPLTGVPGAHRLHSSNLNGRYSAAQWSSGEPFPVDFVLGASMMVRGAAIHAIGGLDEGFFMYCEEMDWCLRLREAGWTVYAVPAARVTHYEGQSSRQVRWPAFVQLWRSRLRFYGKHAARYPLWYLWLVRGLLRSGLAWRSRSVRQRFAAGQIDGAAAGAELTAYRTVREL
jgi:GT2 family glycosyltransferase